MIERAGFSVANFSAISSRIDRARAVVVGAVHDRVAARRTDAARVRDHRIDEMLLLRRRATHGIVRALLARDRVHRAQRVVIDRRRVHADVIVVRADEHVLAGARRIGARAESR